MASPRSQQRLRLRLGISVLFGLFVVFDIALFGWLILKSMSQREIEKVLLQTQEEAEPLAEALQEQAERLGQDDLYVVISVAEETRTYIGSVLSKREIMRSVEIRDQAGTVVFKTDDSESGPLESLPFEDSPRIDNPLIEGGADEAPEIAPGPRLEAEVPIGDMGWLVIGLSEAELQRRIEELRSDLVRQASVVGVLTLIMMGMAFVAILVLSRRAERLEEQAEEAERMAYIGTLASGLAHEIRNPLNSLSLNMQMMEEEARAEGRDGGRLMAITRSELSRLEGLATGFLSYARPQPLELVEAAPAELFEQLREVMAGELKARNVELVINDRSEGQKIPVDRDQIRQLLLNLMQNAIAATAETGRPARVELAAEPHGGRLALEVRDNGGGIPEEDLGKIFDLFFSTRKGGTGLGLAIVERIAQSHGGEVEAASVPGEGATIRVLLPTAKT